MIKHNSLFAILAGCCGLVFTRRKAHVLPVFICLCLIAFTSGVKAQGTIRNATLGPVLVADSTIGFYSTVPQFGGPATVLYLSGNHLWGSFGMTDFWVVTVHFPATATEPASDLRVLGPIVSAYPPFEGFPGGVSISYRADFLLTDNQRRLLFAGKAEIVLMQGVFSTDPGFEPQIVRGPLLPVDSDQDGVPDFLDCYPGTSPDEVVDASGGSIDQICPCDGLWKNHGEYVACVVATVAQFQRQRLITKAEAREIVQAAARSDCGKRRAPREHHGRIDRER